MNEIDTIMAVFAAMGGVETLKWIYKTYVNKDNDKKINDAAADSSEFHTMQEINQYLQQALKEKEERFVDQTKRLRDTQDALFQERKERALLEIKLQNAETWRCNIKLCGKREPPNGM